MCMLLKLHNAKFDVSRLFCSKGIEEKPLGGRLDPPLVKEGLKYQSASLLPWQPRDRLHFKKII